jgi:hypothetical protein
MIRWYYDHPTKVPGLLKEWFEVVLDNTSFEDSERRTASGRPSKARTCFNAKVKEVLNNMSGDLDTHPLNFENLSFNAISHYLQTMRKSLKRAKPSSDDANIMVTETITLRLTASSFDGVCSSLANLFTECEVPKDVSAATKDMWLRLSTYKKGSRRASARERREAGLRTAEGKDPLPVKCLQYLAEVLHRSKEPEHIAALFFCCWNGTFFLMPIWLLMHTLICLVFRMMLCCALWALARQTKRV